MKKNSSNNSNKRTFGFLLQTNQSLYFEIMSKFHLLCVQKIFNILSFRPTKELICQYNTERVFLLEKRYHNLKITSFCHELFFYSDWKWNWRLILLFSEEKGFFFLFALLIILAFFSSGNWSRINTNKRYLEKSFFIIFFVKFVTTRSNQFSI